VLDGYKQAYHKILSDQSSCMNKVTDELFELMQRSIDKTLAMREDLLNNLDIVYSTKEQSYR
jgi:hypothetical protein